MEPDVKQMTINCYSWQNSGSLQFQIYCKYMVFYQTNQETCLLKSKYKQIVTRSDDYITRQTWADVGPGTYFNCPGTNILYHV